MSRSYSRLAQLQRELVKAKSAEERETIEDEIAELEDEIAQEESDKYSDSDGDY
jgi:predicted DNA-binding protein